MLFVFDRFFWICVLKSLLFHKPTKNLIDCLVNNRKFVKMKHKEYSIACYKFR